MKNHKKETSGFTLVELIMVVFVLAIIASIAITQMGNVQKTSAEKVSIANQQQTSRAVTTFLLMNNGTGLDYLDALIDYRTSVKPPPSSPTPADQFDITKNSTTVVGGVYRGCKDSPATTSSVKNKGLYSDLASKLCVFYLSSGNASALSGLGLSTVYYHNYLAGRATELLATNPDGTAVSAAPGFRVESTAAFQQTLTNGVAVLAIDPKKGAALYKAFGHDLKLTSTATDAEAQTAAQACGWYLLAFGLGDQASIIGNRKGGLDSAPRSETLGTDYYRQYFIIVRIPTSPNAFTAEFAGILDPKGQTVKDAKFATEWRNG